MKRALFMLALAVAPLWAQETGNERIARIVHVKYVDPNALRYLVSPFGVDIAPDPKLMVVTLSGRKPNVEAAENAIKELDVPAAAPKDVDLTVYFVVGSDEATAPGSPIPPDLQSTVTALKQTFPFKSYGLLDSLSLRSRAGSGGSTTGDLGRGRLTDFSVRSVSIEGEGNVIRVDRLHAGVREFQTVGEPGKSQYVNVSAVDTDAVDVKEGQKLVIGRSSLEGPGKALFLVLIARVAQ